MIESEEGLEENCVFCKILKGEIPADMVYEDGLCYAFRDINPQAPTHILVIPKVHMESIADVDECGYSLAGHMLTAVAKIAKAEGLRDRGYRVVTNCGPDAGQTVPHLHFHILGGKRLSDSMV